MKQAQFNRTFAVKKEKLDFNVDDEYGRLVQKTSKLLHRSFVATHLILEKFPPGLAAALYDSCLAKWQDLGFNSPSHMWWTERKKKLLDK